MKDRFEVRPLDEGKGFLWRAALWSLSGIGKLTAKTCHLRPREKRQIEVLGGMPQEQVSPVLLDGVDQQQGMMRAHENLELTQLIG